MKRKIKDDPGLVTVGSYVPIPITKRGQVTVGYYGITPPIQTGKISVGYYETIAWNPNIIT